MKQAIHKNQYPNNYILPLLLIIASSPERYKEREGERKREREEKKKKKRERERWKDRTDYPPPT